MSRVNIRHHRLAQPRFSSMLITEDLILSIIMENSTEEQKWISGPSEMPCWENHLNKIVHNLLRFVEKRLYKFMNICWEISGNAVPSNSFEQILEFSTYPIRFSLWSALGCLLFASCNPKEKQLETTAENERNKWINKTVRIRNYLLFCET